MKSYIVPVVLVDTCGCIKINYKSILNTGWIPIQRYRQDGKYVAQLIHIFFL